ncbi:C-C motif chemokine 4-like [Corythoichthys intestinalis]|uniref:C-C motif chemokine 4-like n=1 Tax=Corythoichthys intestinalis TaxID=161448 RepID=UPI0025A4FAB7|nr:C-C motif chemokine 4-like [Corythoichthys intestinalis]
MNPRFAALLLLVLFCSQRLAAQKLPNCCLQTSDKCLPRQILVNYFQQEAGKGCKIGATVFETSKGRKLCARPQDESLCVQKLIAYLDNKNKPNKL